MDPLQVTIHIPDLDPKYSTMTIVVDVAEVGLVPSIFCGPISSYCLHPQSVDPNDKLMPSVVGVGGPDLSLTFFLDPVKLIIQENCLDPFYVAMTIALDVGEVRHVP